MASVLDMRQGIRIIKRHPSVVRYLLGGKRKDQLRKLIHELEKKKMNNYYTREISRSLRMAKRRSVFYESIQPTNSNLVKVNRLCNIEDWHNPRIQKNHLAIATE